MLAELAVAGSAYPGTNHGWYTQAGHGLIGQELWTNTHGATPDSSATWDPLLTANSCYAISAFIPDNYANGTATYTIHAADGTHPAVVNQEAYTNAWAPLGTFKTDITGYVGVTLTDQSPVGFYLAADAVMFAPARPATVHVNENSYTNAWATLGNYTTFDDGSISVELTDLGTTGQYVAADAVRFVPC
ncbi:MAG TPA: hypothetical protein VGA04_11800 [Streptosporangiaceae bacterium]